MIGSDEIWYTIEFGPDKADGYEISIPLSPVIERAAIAQNKTPKAFLEAKKRVIRHSVEMRLEYGMKTDSRAAVISEFRAAFEAQERNQHQTAIRRAGFGNLIQMKPMR